jgi:DNA ligase-1
MFVSPMLLNYSKNNLPFNSDKHIAELKLDGIRLINSNMDQVNLYSRHNNNITAKFPELHDNPTPKGTILDGELIVTDKEGKPDFESMMTRFQSKRKKPPVTFCAFDIIKYKGNDVTGLPLMERKKILEESFIENDYYKRVKVIEDNSIGYFNVIKQHGLEGIVIKDKASRYEVSKRSWSWMKVINWTEVEVYISGYKKHGFGWLVSIGDEKINHPVGVVEFGVDIAHKKAFGYFRKQLVIGEDRSFVYLEPIIRVKVKTRNWTKKGNLRSPVFVEFIL